MSSALLALIIAGPFLALVLIGIGSSVLRTLRARRQQAGQHHPKGLRSNCHE